MSTTTDHYLGIDVHKTDAQVAVLDDEGQVVEEVRVANADLDDLADKYAGSSAALEAVNLDNSRPGTSRCSVN